MSSLRKKSWNIRSNYLQRYGCSLAGHATMYGCSRWAKVTVCGKKIPSCLANAGYKVSYVKIKKLSTRQMAVTVHAINAFHIQFHVQLYTIILNNIMTLKQVTKNWNPFYFQIDVFLQIWNFLQKANHQFALDITVAIVKLISWIFSTAESCAISDHYSQRDCHCLRRCWHWHWHWCWHWHWHRCWHCRKKLTSSSVPT